MSISRLDQLIRFLEESPNDPFLLYGIALEYIKVDPFKANEYFNTLLVHHPDYLPTYYQLAKWQEEKGDFTRAEELYKTGIELAKQQNDRKALSELQTALDEL